MFKNVFPLMIIFAAALTWAQANVAVKYSEFDVDSPARKNFVLSRNAIVNERLSKSPNRKALEAYIKDSLDVEKEIRSLTFKSGTITAVDNGLHRSQDVVFTPKEGEKKVLFSTTQISKKNQFRILTLQPSVSRDKLAIIVYPNGSNDDSFVYILEIASGKILLSHFPFASRRIFWMDDTHIVFKDITVEGTVQIKGMVLKDQGEPEISVLYNRYDIESADYNKIIIVSTDRDHYIIISRELPPFEMSGLKDCEYQGEFDDKMVCTKRSFKNGLNFTDFYSFTREKPELKLERSIPGNLVLINMMDTFIAYVDQQGFEKTVHYQNFKTGYSAKLSIPEYLTVDGVTETESEDELELELSSDLTDTKVIWKTKSFEPLFNDEFKKQMLESENLSLEVKYVMVKSFDGTPVPVRIVHKKDLVPVKAPVLMEVYGGFDSSGYMDPFVNRMNRAFIKRGGVYVGPGLRGGNEYGQGWHQAGMRENKIKTYEDLASVAKYLIDSNISEKSKIAIAGTSNGGLTVAATGLLFPQYFALVMPTNGVLDLMSAKMLDRRFDGWAYEYGDPNVSADAEYLSKISPLENVAKAENGPSFMIFNGRKDTRVNPAHSIKFAKAAADLKSAGKNVDVELLSLNNSGHGVAAPDNDYISLRYRVVFWTRIYDAFGMTF